MLPTYILKNRIELKLPISQSMLDKKHQQKLKKRENWSNEAVFRFYKKINMIVPCSLGWGIQRWPRN